jgi:transcriptional regulator with XRE-family HTH domain
MDIRKSFALALKVIRKSKGLTQEDFSDTSSRTYLSSLERGLKSPTLEKIEAIAQTLGVHPLTLLTLAYADLENKSSKEIFEQLNAQIQALNLNT